MRAPIIARSGPPGSARQKEQPWSEAWHAADGQAARHRDRPAPRRLGARSVRAQAIPRLPPAPQVPRPSTTHPGLIHAYPEPVGDLDSARAFALSLPGSTEEPHFEASSFRVRGKIFATVPPDDEHLHVFVGKEEVRAAMAADPAAFEPLLWGQRLHGLRIRLAAASQPRVAELLEES